VWLTIRVGDRAGSVKTEGELCCELRIGPALISVVTVCLASAVDVGRFVIVVVVGCGRKRGFSLSLR